jgi:hypothetical protein
MYELALGEGVRRIMQNSGNISGGWRVFLEVGRSFLRVVGLSGVSTFGFEIASVIRAPSKLPQGKPEPPRLPPRHRKSRTAPKLIRRLIA